MRNAISADGSLIVYSTSGSGFNFGNLYLRDTVTEETIKVDAAQGVGEPKEGHALLPDGQRRRQQIFFTDTARLDARSQHALAGSDRKRRGQRQRRRRSVRLRSRGHDRRRAAVLHAQGPDRRNAGEKRTDAGAGRDRREHRRSTTSTTSPTARSAPQAGLGQCEAKGTVDEKAELEGKIPPETCNLYVEPPRRRRLGNAAVRRRAVGPRPARLARHPDGRQPAPDDLAGLARTASYLAFMSSRSLTGYDNRDASPKPTAHDDQEVYLYNYAHQQDQLRVVQPDGRQPDGVFDTRDIRRRARAA